MFQGEKHIGNGFCETFTQVKAFLLCVLRQEREPLPTSSAHSPFLFNFSARNQIFYL